MHLKGFLILIKSTSYLFLTIELVFMYGVAGNVSQCGNAKALYIQKSK